MLKQIFGRDLSLPELVKVKFSPTCQRSSNDATVLISIRKETTSTLTQVIVGKQLMSDG